MSEAKRADGDQRVDDAAPVRSPAPVLMAVASALIIVVALGAGQAARGATSAYLVAALAHGVVYAIGAAHVVRRPARGFDLMLILLVAVLLRAFVMTVPARLPPGAGNVFASPSADMMLALAMRPFTGIGGIKLVIALAEAITMLALLGWLAADRQPRERILVYAWHPLPIWLFCAMGQADAITVCLLVTSIWLAARGHQATAGVTLAAAAAARIYPLLLVPALWRRGSWSMPLALAAVSVAITMASAWRDGALTGGALLAGSIGAVGDLGGYGTQAAWLLQKLKLATPSAAHYAMAAVAVLAAVAVRVLLTRDPDRVRPGQLMALAAAFTLATAPAAAGQLVWLVALSVGYLSPSVLMLSLTAMLLDAQLAPPWSDDPSVAAAIYGGFAVAGLIEVALRRRARPTP